MAGEFGYQQGGGFGGHSFVPGQEAAALVNTAGGIGHLKNRVLLVGKREARIGRNSSRTFYLKNDADVGGNGNAVTGAGFDLLRTQVYAQVNDVTNSFQGF